MIACRLPLRAEQASHAGLYIDKFFPAAPDDRRTGSPDPQMQAFQALAGSRYDTPLYKLAFDRWKRFWQSQGDTLLCLEGKVRDRMLTGLGCESVLGTGIRLQHSYGTPLIPGSAVKGILRRNLPRQHRDAAVEDARNVEWFLFGGENKKGRAQFHDAWWVPDAKPPLVLDVLTPHHQKYQAGTGAPTDFDQPVPVQLLGVRGRFLFVIELPNASWREYMTALLKDTLSSQGAGAKRTSGYGIIDLEI